MNAVVEWLRVTDARPGLTTLWAVVCVCGWLEIQTDIKAGPYAWSPVMVHPLKGWRGTVLVLFLWALGASALWSAFTPMVRR